MGKERERAGVKTKSLERRERESRREKNHGSKEGRQGSNFLEEVFGCEEEHQPAFREPRQGFRNRTSPSTKEGLDPLCEVAKVRPPPEAEARLVQASQGPP